MRVAISRSRCGVLLERARLVFVLVVACGLLLALGGGVAQASTAYLEVASFGKEGTGAGEFKGPTGVTIEPSTGDVYVVDGKNLRVQKFGPAGEFILAFGKEVDETKVNEGKPAEANVCTAASHDVCKAGTNGGEPGQFGEELFFGFDHLKGPTGVAVDPETGDVYVADRYNKRIEKFNSEGTYLSQFTGSETPAAAFSEASYYGLGVDGVAVDPAIDTLHGGHDVYVADAGNNVVDVFDSGGTYLRQLTGTSAGAFIEPDGVAFDSAGDAYVLDRGNRAVERFASGEGEGTKLSLEQELTEAEAIAVDAAGDVFVDEHAGGAAHVIEFGPTGKVLVREFGEGSAEEKDPSGIAVEPSAKQAYCTGGYSAGESSDKIWIFEEKIGEPPLATTGEPSALTPTSATVAGKVDPEGTSTKYWFKYGPTEAYGRETTHEPAGDASAESEVKANLETLAPHETYHYRLIAKSAFGEVEGNDKTLTTPGLPPTVGTENSEGISETGTILFTYINPENQDTHYYFQYSTDPTLTSGVSTIPVPPGEDIGSGLNEQSVSQNIEGGLTPNTTYYYRAVAENGTGQAEDVPIEHFTTDALTPTASTGEPSEVTDTTATLSGILDGMGADTHYYFNYGTSNTYGVEAPSPAADAGVVSSDAPVSTQLTGLSPNTTYHYQLVAYNAPCFFGCPPAQTATGEDVAFTTLALPPVAVADASGGNISPNSATVTGSADLQGVGGSYHFEYWPSTAYGSSTPVGTLAASELGQAVNANISGLSPNTTYHYRLAVTNNGGSEYSADETFTTYTTAPAVSTGQATSVGQSTAMLGGSLNPEGAETTYWFQYGTTTSYNTSVPAPGADAGSGSGFQSVTQGISGLAPGTTYHFRLVTNNAGGTSYGADQTFTTASATAPASITTTTPMTPKVTSPPKETTTPKALTRAQKLAKALKACKKKAKGKRTTCEKAAKAKYGPKPKKKAKKGGGKKK